MTESRYYHEKPLRLTQMAISERYWKTNLQCDRNVLTIDHIQLVTTAILLEIRTHHIQAERVFHGTEKNFLLGSFQTMTSLQDSFRKHLRSSRIDSNSIFQTIEAMMPFVNRK